MKIHKEVQGSPEWLKRRRSSRNASEAPIIMGASKNVTRTKLLDMKITGSDQEFSEWFVKNILERGHEVEALARPIAEEIIGEELYPISASSDDGYLSASFDGVTMLGEVIWECKQWNETKAAEVREGRVPECDAWQVIQQLSVSEAEKCLYMVTDGTKEKMVYTWRSLIPGEESTLRAGWAQLEEDAESHKPKNAEIVREGKAPESLPALHIEVTGMVTASNLEAFKSHALSVIGGINKDLQTDEDFADAEKTVKWLGDVEKRLDAAKEHALSQTASIDALFRAVDEIKETGRRTRLDLEKLVKARKEARREEIRRSAADAFRDHIDALNDRLGRVRLPHVAADFAGAMKGKRTIASLEDAVSVELARVKIESSRIADDYTKNLATIDTEGKGYEFLFSDIAELVTVSPAHLAGVIQVRIASHQAEEKRKDDEQRERIRREEQAKAQQEADAKIEEDRERIREEEQAKAKADAAQAAPVTQATDLHGPRGSVAYAADGQPATQEAEKPRIRQQPSRTRPTDKDIINALAMTYRTDAPTVVGWLKAMDLSAIAA